VNNWKVIFATAVIFGAGVITGGLMVNYVQHGGKKIPHNKPAALAEAQPAGTNQSIRLPENAKPRTLEVWNKQFLQQLSEPLSLTSEQKEEIQKIITDGQSQIRKAVQDARQNIRERLTPEQQQRYDELMKRPVRRPPASTNAPASSPPPANNP
jgi:Spy/CpxP family protein refolding chaperone